jgi:hypothetical protein
MSAYVRSIKPKRNLADGFEGHSVDYSDQPKLRFAIRGDAEGYRQALQGWGVHVGSHYCDFALDPLSNGEFAIVCTSHRPPRVDQDAPS